jgi:hypothetical protein
MILHKSAKSASSAYDPELIVWGAIYLTGKDVIHPKDLHISQELRKYTTG